MVEELIKLSITETTKESQHTIDSYRAKQDQKFEQQQKLRQKIMKPIMQDPENRLLKGFSASIQSAMTFSQNQIPFEERIKSLEVLGKLFHRNCTITDLVEESMRRIRVFQENESCKDMRTAQQKVEAAIDNMKNPMSKVLKDIITIGNSNRQGSIQLAPVHRQQLSRMRLEFKDVSDDEVHTLLREAIHGSEFMNKNGNETTEVVYLLIDQLGNKTQKLYKDKAMTHDISNKKTAAEMHPTQSSILPFDYPVAQISNDEITSLINSFLVNPKIAEEIRKSNNEQIKRDRSPFNPKKKKYGGANPTKRIIDKHQSIIKLYKFSEDVDNSSEDNFSDDELIAQIKVEKCKERIKRADMTTEAQAISQLIQDVEQTSKKVVVKSIIDKGINLSDLRAKQAKLRELIDSDQTEITGPDLVQNQTPLITPENTNVVSQPVRSSSYQVSQLSNQQVIQKQREMYSKRLRQFNIVKSTIACNIDEERITNKIYNQQHKIYTIKSRSLTEGMSSFQSNKTKNTPDPLADFVKRENFEMRENLATTLSMVSSHRSLEINQVSKESLFPKQMKKESLSPRVSKKYLFKKQSQLKKSGDIIQLINKGIDSDDLSNSISGNTILVQIRQINTVNEQQHKIELQVEDQSQDGLYQQRVQTTLINNGNDNINIQSRNQLIPQIDEVQYYKFSDQDSGINSKQMQSLKQLYVDPQNFNTHENHDSIQNSMSDFKSDFLVTRMVPSLIGQASINGVTPTQTFQEKNLKTAKFLSDKKFIRQDRVMINQQNKQVINVGKITLNTSNQFKPQMHNIFVESNYRSKLENKLVEKSQINTHCMMTETNVKNLSQHMTQNLGSQSDLSISLINRDTQQSQASIGDVQVVSSNTKAPSQKKVMPKSFDMNQLGSSYDTRISTILNASITNNVATQNLNKAIALDRLRRKYPKEMLTQSLTMTNKQIQLMAREFSLNMIQSKRDVASSQLDNPLLELNEEDEDSSALHTTQRTNTFNMAARMIKGQNIVTQTSSINPSALSILEHLGTKSTILNSTFRAQIKDQPLSSISQNKIPSQINISNQSNNRGRSQRKLHVEDIQQRIQTLNLDNSDFPANEHNLPPTPQLNLAVQFTQIQQKEIKNSFSTIQFGDVLVQCKPQESSGKLKGALFKPKVKQQVFQPIQNSQVGITSNFFESPKITSRLPEQNQNFWRNQNNVRNSYEKGEGTIFGLVKTHEIREPSLAQLPPGSKRQSPALTRRQIEESNVNQLSVKREPASAAYILMEKLKQKSPQRRSPQQHSPQGDHSPSGRTEELSNLHPTRNNLDIDRIQGGYTNTSYSNEESKANFISELAGTKSSQILQISQTNLHSKKQAVARPKMDRSYGNEIAVQTFEFVIDNSIEIKGSTLTPLFQPHTAVNPQSQVSTKRNVVTTKLSRDSSSERDSIK